MTRRLRESIRGAALCLVAMSGAVGAHAAPLSPTWNMRAPAPETTVAARGGIAPDPVLPVLESIGQASEPPRLADGGLRIAEAPRLSGGDGASEILFAGGVASSGGNTRLMEGVTEARDPVQLLPPEPTVAVRISGPLPHALLAAVAAVIVLRNRARIAKRLGV